MSGLVTRPRAQPRSVLRPDSSEKVKDDIVKKAATAGQTTLAHALQWERNAGYSHR